MKKSTLNTHSISFPVIAILLIVIQFHPANGQYAYLNDTYPLPENVYFNKTDNKIQSLDEKNVIHHVDYNVSSMLFRHIRFGYERHRNDQDFLRFDAGMKWSEPKISVGTLFYLLEEVAGQNHVYAYAGYGGYMGKSLKTSLSLHLTYTYSFYSHKEYMHGSGLNDEVYFELRSEKKSMVGTKILINRRTRYIKDRMYFTFYFGLGLRVIPAYNEVIHDSVDLYTYYADGLNDDGNDVYRHIDLTGYPTIHGGLRVGFAWKNKQ